MKFELHEADKLMWPGKYGLAALLDIENAAIGVSNWEAIVEKSGQLVAVAAGRANERPTCFFSSERDLGRVELVYRHGYIWPMDPPRGGRAIMEELLDHLNKIATDMQPIG